MKKFYFLMTFLLVALVGAAQDRTFQKITSPSDVQAGDNIVLVCENTAGPWVMADFNDSNYFNVENTTITNNTITISTSSKASILSVGGGDNNQFTLKVGDVYLLYTKDTGTKSNNNLFTNKSLDNNKSGLWTFEIANNSYVRVKNARATDRYIQFNSSQKDRFACYTGTQGNAAIYKEIQPTVATPTFDPNGGKFSQTDKTVTISCETEDATIHYTLSTNDVDGEEQTGNTVELKYVENQTTTYTIKAYAKKEGMADSQYATATYTITDEPLPLGRMFMKIESADEIKAGDKVVFVADLGYAAGALVNKNYTPVPIVILPGYEDYAGKEGVFLNLDNKPDNNIDGVADNDGEVSIFEVEVNDQGDWAFKKENDVNYLNCTDSSTDIKESSTISYWSHNDNGEISIGSRSIIYRGLNYNTIKNYATSNINNNNNEYYQMYLYKFSTELTSGVESNVVAEDAVITAIEGGVAVSVAAPSAMAVYTIAGQTVTNGTVAAQATINLPNGFYIVKVGNTVKKVIVR